MKRQRLLKDKLLETVSQNMTQASQLQLCTEELEPLVGRYSITHVKTLPMTLHLDSVNRKIMPPTPTHTHAPCEETICVSLW